MAQRIDKPFVAQPVEDPDGRRERHRRPPMESRFGL
jgi:hypothetical protein